MKKLLVIIFVLSAVAMATVNFPYPQAHPYKNGIIATNWNCAGQTASSMLKSHFTTYLSKYYEESGDMARIKFDEPKNTVSEGIGYGMIMMVYFSDNTTSYQSQFDKLWNYYQHFTNGNGLMNWKIQGFNSVIGQNGATDADEDVAFALIMAYYQFGNEQYKNDAISLISKIRQKEFNSNGMHKVGDAWDSYKNPSYVSPAAYEVFKKFDTGNADFWSSAISTNYTLLQKNQHSTTGIPSGWSDGNGNAIKGNNGYNFTGYDYDATRAPWRWSWSYAWYGHTQAKSLADKLASWVNGKLPSQLPINVKQDGTTDANVCSSNGCEANGSSIGSFSTVLITDSKYQEKLNNNYQALMTAGDGYYHSSLRMLTGLLMSGNMQDFSDANYTNQPFTFALTEEQEAECNARPDYHVNSGAYGWNSTSAVLTDESETGVHMGDFIRGLDRSVTKELGEVTAGEQYTFSIDILQEVGYEFNLKMKIQLYDDSDKGEQYCGEAYSMSSGNVVTYTCAFTATKTANPFLSMSTVTWNVPAISFSNLSLKNSSGEEIAPPPDGVIWKGGAFAQKKLGKVLAGRLLEYTGISNNSTISMMDLQGRVLLRRQVQGSGVADLSSLRAGTYVVQLKGSGVSEMKRIQLR